MSNLKWTEVTDPTTLKVGDKIRVGVGSFVVEGTLTGKPWLPDYEVMAHIELEGAAEVIPIPIGAAVFVAEKPFAVMNRTLEPGEVVEDSMGRKYTTNPLNPALIITDTMGLTGPEEFIYMAVRPVR